jgi:hypothetical protein
MRSVEEIRAEIKNRSNFQASNMIELTEKLADIKMLEKELLVALVAGIPLDRLELICNAERERRCVIFTTTESAKKAAEEAWAEAFCDL